ncbi:MAG: hypothetical protein EAZ91_05655 [Cytophagales bacterium]|nr:MAG: hypothetical protein EAZ91_05655 [Cytophagales bacterium]
MNNFEDAQADFDKAVQLNPKHVQALFSRGYCRGRTEGKREGLADIDKAIEIGLPSAKTKLYFSDFLIQSVMPVLSYVVRDRYRISELTDDVSEAFLLRGLYKNALGDNRGAIIDVNQAIDLNPGNGESYFVRGIIKSSVGDQKGAQNDCTNALKLAPAHREAYYLRGVIRYDAGDEVGGCADLGQAGQLGFAQAYPIISTKCNRALRRPEK